VREKEIELETRGFKFLSLSFGETFKGRNLKPSGFKYTSNPQGFEPSLMRGIKISSLGVQHLIK